MPISHRRLTLLQRHRIVNIHFSMLKNYRFHETFRRHMFLDSFCNLNQTNTCLKLYFLFKYDDSIWKLKSILHQHIKSIWHYIALQLFIYFNVYFHFTKSLVTKADINNSHFIFHTSLIINLYFSDQFIFRISNCRVHTY